MSYAEQIGDKFYWMNPPDAREGDECYGSSEWHLCPYGKEGFICGAPNRRRLIAPGEGFRILGTEEVPLQGTEILFSDRLEWVKDAKEYLGRWDLDGYSIEKIIEVTNGMFNILAIRQRIPVEAGKEQSNLSAPPMPVSESIYTSPRVQAVLDAARDYIKHNIPMCSDRGKALESALAALDKEPTKDGLSVAGFSTGVRILINDLESIAYTARVSAEQVKLLLKEQPPAEALARMEGKADKFTGDLATVLDVLNNSHENLNLYRKEILEVVKFYKQQKEVPQKVEGGDAQEWLSFAVDFFRSPTTKSSKQDLMRQLEQFIIAKQHAAKGKERGV